MIMRGITFLLLHLFISAVSLAQGNSRIPFLLDKLKDGGKSGYVMVIAHRGDWRHAPENSLQAFENCIKQEVDAIEVDISETKDGELIVMHDATLNRTTNGTGKIADHTLQEIKSLKLRGGNNVLTRHAVPSLAELFVLCKGKVLIQVDKWPPVREKILALARKHDCLNQLIFRSTAPSAQIKAIFGDDLKRINFIPVVTANGEKDIERLKDYEQNMKFSAIGIAFNKIDYPIFAELPALRQQQVRIWFNAILGDKFNAGHDDDLAVNDLKNSYGLLLEKGANMIMTDRPFELISYLKTINKR
jgi:glycerophosphoryl diester phosphodiesterase